MSEIISAPTSQPPDKKTNIWLIVIVVVVVLFCCCFGVIGLFIGFGQDILNELGSYFSFVLQRFL